jgi:glutamate 5-kinase
MMEADLMVILTNQDGYFDKNPDKYPDAKIIKKCNTKNLNEDDFNLDEKSSVGTGGFKTKIRSVKMATTRNCPSIIASGYRKDVIKQILNKKIIGTFFYSEE